VTTTDQLLQSNAAYAQDFAHGDLPMPPSRQVAVLTCMDARIVPSAALGIAEGDAHVIRNAGGVASDDAIRSLLISQRLLGTTEIVVIHHTDCGMLTFRDDELKDAITTEVGIRPHFALESFTDVAADVRQTLARINASPFIPHLDNVRGFIFDVATGLLEEVRPTS
jgi:carbonic anhydrase